jgi:hypothetical protein
MERASSQPLDRRQVKAGKKATPSGDSWNGNGQEDVEGFDGGICQPEKMMIGLVVPLR